MRKYTTTYIVQKTDLSADADVLANFLCMTGNLWNHGMYFCMNFNSLIIFHYQYCRLFRQDQRAKYTHLKISWYFLNIT